jgi:MFS family permease
MIFRLVSYLPLFNFPVLRYSCNGKLADRFGRKPLLIISLAGTVVANFIAGTATTATILFLARFLDGITGGNNSVAQAVISDVTTPENRARGFGVLGTALGWVLS